MTIRCCVVGLGYWGKNLCRVLGASPRFDLVGGVDLLDVPGASSSLEHFVARAAVDAVVIATPASTHAAIGLDALERGYHVLVEKPLATSVVDGEKLVAAARDGGRVLMVDLTYLYSPRFSAFLTALTALGEPTGVITHRLHDGGPQDVSALYDLLPHDLAIIGALLPDWTPTMASAHGTPEVGQVYFDGLTDRPAVFIHYSRRNEFKSRFVSAETPRGIVSWQDVATIPATAVTRPLHVERDGWSVVVPFVDHTEPLAAVVADFADAIEGRESGWPTRATGEFALNGLRIIEAAERSLASGKPESIIR